MPVARRNHGTLTKIAAAAAVLAMVGMFLPWWGHVPTDSRLPKVSWSGMDLILHSTGLLTLLLLLTGSCSLVVAAEVRARAVATVGALLLASGLLAAATALILQPYISALLEKGQLPTPPMYGWWISALAGLLATLLTSIAIRRVFLELRLKRGESEVFD